MDSNAYFVIGLMLYILCIDQGDGHWKERDRENLRHDMDLFRKMEGKIERKIENFYYEYPEQRYKADDFVETYNQYYDKDILDHKTKTGKENENYDKTKQDNISFRIPKKATYSQPLPASIMTSRQTMKHETSESNNRENSRILNSTWPKFEDILLAMGKKYDWKNDRWIKVKDKIKKPDNNVKTKPNRLDNSRLFHEKHNFSYKIVRLNKSKSRSSVVVAVSAVR